MPTSVRCGRPGFERGAIGDGERQMVEPVSGRSGRRVARRRRLGQHHDEPPATVLQRDVADVGIVREGNEAQHGAVPLRTGADVGHQQLHVRQPGDGGALSGVRDRGHPTDPSETDRAGGRCRTAPGTNLRRHAIRRGNRPVVTVGADPRWWCHRAPSGTAWCPYLDRGAARRRSARPPGPAGGPGHVDRRRARWRRWWPTSRRAPPAGPVTLVAHSSGGLVVPASSPPSGAACGAIVLERGAGAGRGGVRHRVHAGAAP